METQPLVSIIVPTKNSQKLLATCLKSVRAQTYPQIELIVVDQNSKDATKQIAGSFADRVLNFGRERSEQRNYGTKQARGEFVCFIDSDMELSPGVIGGCVRAAGAGAAGVIIPEESVGEGFWAQCKRLEKSFYVGVEWMEAARFFTRAAFEDARGYDEALVSGEDWDLSQRVHSGGRLGRIDERIFHHEGRVSLFQTVKKKFYYAKKITKYMGKHKQDPNLGQQTSIFRRFELYFHSPAALLKNPIVGCGMLFMKICEFGFGAIGYLLGASENNSPSV